MGRERFRNLEVRFSAKLTSALALQQWRRERTLSNEAGHASPPLIDTIPQDQEIVLFQPRECLDTKVFNQSVTRGWVENSNPREDAWSPPPSRINPSS